LPGDKKISKKRGTPVEKNGSNYEYFFSPKMVPKIGLIKA
jgi:hypothetical protein